MSEKRFIGETCKKCRGCERYVSSGECCYCAYLRTCRREGRAPNTKFRKIKMPGSPLPSWKLPSIEECETLGGIAFRLGDKGPAETVVGPERLNAWHRGWVNASLAANEKVR